MNKRLLFLGILIVVAALFFIYKNAPEKSGMQHARPDVSMEAAALFAEFSNDESGANEKYLNKVVIVSGTVENAVGGAAGKMPTLHLATGSDDGSVICTFDAQSSPQKKEFHVGENVKLKCICLDYYRDVKLVGCVF